jgi:hypothetical protein
MFPREFYIVVHMLGVFMVMSALGGITLHSINGGTRDYIHRKWIAMVHGIGLLIALIGGFGLLAKLGMESGLPVWAIVKLLIWVTLGGLPALIYRHPKRGKLWLFVFLAFAVAACALGSFKPSF